MWHKMFVFLDCRSAVRRRNFTSLSSGGKFLPFFAILIENAELFPLRAILIRKQNKVLFACLSKWKHLITAFH